jgi:hypothetical protein
MSGDTSGTDSNARGRTGAIRATEFEFISTSSHLAGSESSWRGLSTSWAAEEGDVMIPEAVKDEFTT